MAELTEEEIAEWKAERQRVVGIIIEQYTECTRALNELFRMAPDQCWAKDGIGCCDVDMGYAEEGLDGPAKTTLDMMRAARLDEENTTIHACPYHKENFGCILGELKAPRCAAHYCRGDLRGTGYSYRRVREVLEKVLWGGLDPHNTAAGYNPERNAALVRGFKAYVDGLMAKVRALATVSADVAHE